MKIQHLELKKILKKLELKENHSFMTKSSVIPLMIVLKKKYEINVYNITLDTVIESLENRYSKHKEIYVYFEWLHPINFKLIKT
jgi:hypothetical protein